MDRAQGVGQVENGAIALAARHPRRQDAQYLGVLGQKAGHLRVEAGDKFRHLVEDGLPGLQEYVHFGRPVHRPLVVHECLQRIGRFEVCPARWPAGAEGQIDAQPGLFSSLQGQKDEIVVARSIEGQPAFEHLGGCIRIQRRVECLQLEAAEAG